MSAYLENMNISRGHVLASTALVLSVLAILFAVSMRATPCVSAASGSCSVGEDETFAGTLALGTAGDIEYEGATDDDFETTLAVTDPTADRTITFPDATGTVALASVGALAVADGGTGQTTLAADGVLIGNATGGITVTAAGNAGEVLTSNGAGSDPTYQAGPSGGIPRAEQWRVHTDNTIAQQIHSGNGAVVVNWEKNDTAGSGEISAGITESSGVFTFPETGIWMVQGVMQYSAAPGPGIVLETCQDYTTGPTWIEQFWRGDDAHGTGNVHNQALHIPLLLFDVQDTAEDKLQLKVGSVYSSGTLMGDTNGNESVLLFMRLGDT